MATTLWLYKECKISKDRNARVDSIENYLVSLLSVSELLGIEIQHQKVELNMKLKLVMDQKYASQSRYNYAKISQDSKNYYFFINGANWKSTNTVEFDLELDTVNTFASDFTFNKKTHITRQHKDRLIKLEDDIIYNIDYSKPMNWDSDEAMEYPAVKGYVQYRIGPLYFRLTGQREYHYLDSSNNTGTILREYNADGTLNNSWTGKSMEYQYRVEIDPLDPEHPTYYGTFILYNRFSIPVWSLSESEINNKFEEGRYFTVEIQDEYENIYGYQWSWDLFDAVRCNSFIRKIDTINENVNPIQYKTNQSILEDKVERDELKYPAQPWVLVYRNKTSYDPSDPQAFDKDNVVDIYLCPKEQEVSVAQVSVTANITPSELDTGYYYYVVPDNFTICKTRTAVGLIETTEWITKSENSIDSVLIDSTSGKKICDFRNGNFPGTQYWNTEIDHRQPKWFVLYKDGGKIHVKRFYCNNIFVWDVVTYHNYWVTGSEDLGKFDSIYLEKYSSINTYKTDSEYNTWEEIYRQFKNNHSFIKLIQGETINKYTIQPFSTFSITDSKLIKCIEIPYAFLDTYADLSDPDNPQYLYSILNTVWSITVESGYNRLKLINPNSYNVKFNRQLEYDASPLNLLYVTEGAINTSGTPNLRNDIYESKIYNSEFFTPKFVYDSFNYTFKLEDINEEELNGIKPLSIDYKVTNTINSNFLFTFDIPLKRSVLDYDNICLVRRNNELPIYNSEFVNYVKTGYNYDKKRFERDTWKTGINGLLSTAQAAVVGGFAGGSAGTAVGMTSQAARTITDLYFNSQNEKANIQQKLEEAMNSAVTVNGSDDIDLLDAYADNNKAKFTVYSCSDRVKELTLDLFYYGGYSDNIQEVPNLNTRLWFNFIQCEPVFNEETTTPYYEFLEDIKRRYSEGVTVYHRNDYGTEANPIKYDWDQIYENWEVSLIPEGE